MATLNLTFETTAPLSRIFDAFVAQYGEPLGGETRQEFMRRMVRQFIRDVVRAAETRVAEDTARGGVTDIPLT